jgi:hypothetical protein
MVRFGSLFKSATALAFSAVTAGGLAAAEIPVLNGHVTVEQWHGLSESSALAGCDSTPCAVLRSVVKSFTELNA